MTSKILRNAIALTLAAGGAALFLLGAAPPDAGGGGGEGETATNHLSYPAVNLDGAAVTSSFSATVDTLGTTYSFACNKPETIGTTTFPNTSCVTADGSKYLSATECSATGAVCEGLPVEKTLDWVSLQAGYITPGYVQFTVFIEAHLAYTAPAFTDQAAMGAGITTHSIIYPCLC